MPDLSFGGSSKQKPITQTRNVAPASPQEVMLQQMNMQAAQQQAQELQRAIQAQKQYEQSGGFQQAQQLGQQAGGLLQQDMAGGQLISSPQQAALQQYFQSMMNPAMEQMQRAGAQEAARRGMTLSDSPAGGEFARQMAAYQAQMGGQQAGQALQLQQNNRGMQQSLMGLGQQLQQNAQQNRLALSQAQPGSYGLGNQLAQQRIQSAPTVTSGGATTQAPKFNFSLGNTLDAAQKGMQLYHGTNPEGLTPGIKSFWG